MSEEKRKIYHYLHNSASGCVEGEWKNGKLCFVLPLIPAFSKATVNADSLEKYQIAVDPRDQRTLVVFDGHVPWGGLPKGGDFVNVLKSISIKTPVQSLRKQNHREEDSRLKFASAAYSGKGAYVYLDIYRYVFLLPKSVSCVRKYDSRSLRPIYTFIEINEKGVTWRTHSY